MRQTNDTLRLKDLRIVLQETGIEITHTPTGQGFVLASVEDVISFIPIFREENSVLIGQSAMPDCTTFVKVVRIHDVYSFCVFYRGSYWPSLFSVQLSDTDRGIILDGLYMWLPERAAGREQWLKGSLDYHQYMVNKLEESLDVSSTM